MKALLLALLFLLPLAAQTRTLTEHAELMDLLRNAKLEQIAIDAIVTHADLQRSFLKLGDGSEAAVFRFVDQLGAVTAAGGELDKRAAAKTLVGLVRSEKYRAFLSWAQTATSAQPGSPPRYLFHWVGDGTLKRMNEYNPDPTRVPLRFIKSNQYVAQAHPELIGKPGLFAWTNPVTGMAISKAESYFDATERVPARLLVMKPRAGARVVEIFTNLDQLHPVLTPGLDKADLVLNRAYKGGILEYSEWIVLNPKAIHRFSADPAVTAPLFREELKRLKRPGVPYPDEQLFAPAFRNKAFWLKNIRQFLANTNSQEIPAELRLPMTVEGWNTPPSPPQADSAARCGRLYGGMLP